MAPQASLVAPTPTVQSSVPSTPANASPKPWIPIPVAFSIFFGVCLAYTLSYVLYRIVMSRRRGSEEGVPDSPDRGVSQFMNGARLTLNFHKSTPLTLDDTPNVPDEEKPLTDPSHPARSATPTSSPGDSSSAPFIVSLPSFTIHPNKEPDEARLREQDQGSPKPDSPIPTPAPAQQPFSQRVAAKVKILSRDRAEAIALDPKLAPVQGPLRPLSMVPSPTRKERTMALFGLGLKHHHPHGHDGHPESDFRKRDDQAPIVP